MLSLDSRAEYRARMHRVLAHIDTHLDQPLDLATLAGVAHFSPFHFHRVFAASMGETLGDYMRLAAQPRTRVLNLALSVGFGSAEAFTRAFKARFACSPTAWRAQQAALRRANRNPGQVFPQPFTHHEASHNPNKETLMKVKVIDRQSATIAYLRHLGSYGDAVARFWQEAYVPWAVMNRLGPDHARYGISHDDPSITAPAQCRYDACAEVAPDFVVNGGAQKAAIPGGKYAVLAFRGTVAQVGEAWAAILRDWLPDSGLQLDARPSFEYYPKGSVFDPKTGEFECEICIPVVPL